MSKSRLNHTIVTIFFMLVPISVNAQEITARCAFHGFAHSNNSAENFATFCSNGNFADRKISYYIENTSRHIGRSSTNAIKRAMNTWTQAAGIIFVESNTPNADLRIRFVDANKSYNKNLVGNALAHALIHNACEQGRIIEIDETEHRWFDGATSGAFDVQSVVLHELGHILGFDHSTSPTSTMWPTVSTNFVNRGLNEVDINGLSFLYPGTYYSTGDNVRGFSWDPKTKRSSYPVFFPKENSTKVVVRNFAKPNAWDGNLDVLFFGTGDILRGWNWDQTRNEVSYLVYLKGKGTHLNIRSFDGQSFGPVTKSVEISNHDILNGWSWDRSRNLASYVVLIGDKYTVIDRSFDGEIFGPVVTEAKFATAGEQVVRSWNYRPDISNVSYHVWRSGANNTILGHRDYDGRGRFGAVEN